MAEVSDTALPLASGARPEPPRAGASTLRSKKVEPELRDAVWEETLNAAPRAQPETPQTKRKRLQRDEVDRLATKVLEVGRGEEGQEDFVEKLGALLLANGRVSRHLQSRRVTLCLP